MLGDGASEYLHLIFLNSSSFSFSLGSVEHSFCLVFFFIWLEDLRDNWNPAGNIFGVPRWEGEIGWRWGWVEATSHPTGDECQLLRFGGGLLWLLWEPHIDAVSVIFLLPIAINSLTLKYYHDCCSLNKYPVLLKKKPSAVKCCSRVRQAGSSQQIPLPHTSPVWVWPGFKQ